MVVVVVVVAVAVAAAAVAVAVAAAVVVVVVVEVFSIVVDYVLKQLDLKGNISTRIKQCSAYAHDVLLTTRTIHLSR